MKTLRCLIFRHDDEGRNVAIVTATVDDDFGSESRLTPPSVLVGVISEAVTEWAKTTEEGREAIETSCHDFNVGDLTDCLTDKNLMGELEKRGVYRLDIEVVGEDFNHNWDYDDILFDEMKI